MLGLVRRGVEVTVLVLAAYDSLLATRAWPDPPVAPEGPRRRRFRVVVPAHNEAHVLSGVLDDLAAQDYPSELVRVVVVADRCDDDTAAVARRQAEAVERWEGAPGKGPALGWYLERDPLTDDEALVVFDADTRLSRDVLARFADELDAGHEVLQANLDVTNVDDSVLTVASALSYWTGNRMTQVARRNLGWSADLGGTGMCLTAPALTAAGGFGDTLTEDRELALRLLLRGIPVTWVHHARIFDEKPAGMSVAVRQRARWRSGTGQVRRRYLWPVLRYALRQRSGSGMDHALRLVRPTRSMVIVLTAAAAAGAAIDGSLLSRRTWLGLLAAQLAQPPVYLARDGVAPRYIACYPLAVVFPIMSPVVRLLARAGSTSWFHTPHRGTR